jgi:site-specific recombinase XerD
VEVYDQMLVDFTNFMKVDRGLSPITVEYRCRSVRPFLDRLFERKQSLETITVSDLDSLLAEKVNDGHYARISTLSIRHHEPHSLRHACATRLINQGFSLKEIGDHLGQRNLEATRIYAKVDLVRFAKWRISTWESCYEPSEYL